MTEDEQVRRIDGLLVTYGQIQRDLGELEARSTAIEKAMGAAAVEFARILLAVETSCNNSTGRLEVAVEKQGKRFEVEVRKIHDQQIAAKWTRGQWLTLAALFLAVATGIILPLAGVGGG